ncbi:MAG: hypothetical protein ACFFE6_08350 [Candidatus Thorarchaeota archaeon]
MSAEWGLLPLGIEESDLMMLILALFILSVFVIAIFMTLPLFSAVLVTVIIVLSIAYGVRELKQKQDSSG